MSDRCRLDQAVLVRLSSDLATQLNAAAEAANMSSAGFVRDLITDALHADPPIASKPSPRRSARPDLSSAETQMKLVVRSLGLVGAATIQLTEALRVNKRDQHPTAEQVLADLRAVAAEVRELVRRIGL